AVHADSNVPRPVAAPLAAFGVNVMTRSPTVIVACPALAGVNVSDGVEPEALVGNAPDVVGMATDGIAMSTVMGRFRPGTARLASAFTEPSRVAAPTVR